MLKVQALMSITMGLQQVAQTLNKDSAFSLVTLNGLREWWNNLLDVGRGKQEAEIIAIKANTAAEIENAVAVEANAGVKDRKSTRLNSSHANISYAVFCLKKKN